MKFDSFNTDQFSVVDIDESHAFFCNETRRDGNTFEDALLLEYIKSELTGDQLDILSQLMSERNIPSSERDAFEAHIAAFEQDVVQRKKLSALPDKPERDIRPYEGVIGYIKDSEGLGPWLAAGVLTRPKIKELSPRGYMALANWLKNPRHSLETEGLNIPDRTAVTRRELADNPIDVRELRRLLRAHERSAKAELSR